MGELLTIAAAARRDALLAWGLPRLRDLPWRRTRDPWSVLVSEVMLQQTQVARVVPAYLSFMPEFPTPAACAARPVGDVVMAWAGLGYNRRAVGLHRAAVAVTSAGRFPCTLRELLALPGVGPYTARALLAFAYERDVAVVDTNVARALARAAGRRLTVREVQAAADAHVPPGQAWAWNQVAIEFGATVCTARSPSCAGCPVRQQCTWRGAGADPATGSAGVSGGQSRFSGSDRQGRGRLVDALRRGSVSGEGLGEVMGWPDDRARAERVAATLVADGLAVTDGSAFRLP